MSGNRGFQEVFEFYLKRARFTCDRMSKASGVPKATLENWRHGVVRSPRYWQDIVKVALSLDLDEEHTNDLLVSGGHSTLDELLKSDLVDKDKELLARFRPSTRHKQNLSGVIDVNPKGADLLKNYDVWFTCKATARWQIWRLNTHLGEANPISFEFDDDLSEHDQYVPAVSPDGRMIAFASQTSMMPGQLSRDLFLADLANLRVRRLTDSCLDAYSPSWAPDGRAIVYHAGSWDQPDCPDTYFGVWVFDIRTGQSRQLTDQTDHDPAWSPDGRYIAYHSGRGNQVIKILDYASYRGTVNSCDSWVAVDMSMNSRAPAWRNSHGLVYMDHFEGSWQIYEIPVKPNKTYTNPRRLTSASRDNTYPAVYDSNILLWQAYPHERSGNANRETDKDSVIYVMDLRHEIEIPLISGIGNMRDGCLSPKLFLPEA